MKKTRWIDFLGGYSLLFTVVIAFLVAITIFVLTKIEFIFTPLIVIVSNILMPLIIAVLLYYLIDPLVTKMSQKMSRTWAVALVFILIFVLIGLFTAVLIPVLEEQVTNLIETIPVFIDDMLTQAQNFAQNLPANDVFNQLIDQAQNISDSVFHNFGDVLSTGLTNVSGVVSGVTNVFFTLAVAPIILFFLLKDEQKIVRGLLYFTPPKWRQGLIRIGTEVNIQVGAYIKGQFTIAILNAIMMFIGFSLIGLNYAGALGVLGGIMSLIPYIGPTMTFVPAVIIAGFDSFTKVLLLVGVWLLIQFIEGNLIEPNVMGKQLHVHPVTIIVTLLVMGDLFGLFGLVFGIPMYAILKVIVSYFFRLFKARYNKYFGHEVGEYQIDRWHSDKFGDDNIEETKDAYVEYLENKELE